MSTLNLSDQKATKNVISPKILQLKQVMDLRKDIWSKLPVESKKKWITSEKDPIMTIAYDMYKYLHNNFFGEETDEYL